MIKQYFTDGLIQIAIILSLLRTDLNNWHLHNNYINYPEVQDIILGQSLAYTTTNFHNQYNTFNSLGGSVHPKSIDNDFSSAIFRDLRSLSRFRRFDGIATEVNAFLVSETALGLASAASGQVDSHSSEDSNNNHAHPAIPTQSTSASVQDDVDNQPTTSDVCPVDDNDNAGAVGISPTSLTGSEPTDEDLDLIDVLWRQDIDLGVGKDAFDINLRRELERDREIELQKKREKEKELELLRQKVEEDRRQQQQQWIQQNFTQDGETGEWIPLNGGALQTPPPDFTVPVDNALSLEEALDILSAETGTFVNTDYTPVPENSPQMPLQPQPHLSPPVAGMDSYLLNADNYNNQSVQQSPPANMNRQESLDQRWDDLVSLLDLVGVNGSHLAAMNNSQITDGMNNSQLDLNTAVVNSAAPQMNITNMNTPQMNVSSMISMNSEVNTTNTVTSQPLPSPCVNGSVLLQNATLPPPVANVSMPAVVNTTNMSPINSTAFLPPTTSFNSSVPNTDTLQEALDWEASDMLFSNVTADHSDPALEDVDGILPDFLPEDELDMAINEGLQTMQMLDEASSDSAVSMGSASPLQELSDSGAMSPYDGLEGATGGSDYGSPSYSKASKYDPEEYHYGYSSCSYSHSDSSQTNYSTSSNDTDINKPSHGGNNHINHNHTYPLKPGASPKEIKTSIKTDKPKTKGPHARDAKRAFELKIPFSVDQIIESPVEEFNEMITKYKLTEPQIQLIRDIRRRGKNKVAAQNCRKRKLDVVVTLEDEMTNLQEMKDQLIRERQQIDKQTREMKEKFSHMYQEIFRSLRDEHGHPYDPNEYSLQQSSDGNVFLVPRNMSADDQQMNGKKRKNDKKIE